MHQMTVNERTARRDPTRTTMLRQQYVVAARSRFRALKGLISETIVQNDALLLSDRRSVANASAARRYDFPSDLAGKSSAFMDWLYDAMDDDILEITLRDGRRIVSHNAWQNVYVRAGYGRGVDMASTALRQAGIEISPYSLTALFNSAMHAEALAMLFVRNFDELRGITDVMGQQIARTLAEGLARGLGPRQVAQLINERVDGIGINRALTLARTEIIRAHAEASLNRYEEFGLQGVMGRAEWVTAGDDKVCPLCAALEGKQFTIQEARGMLPLHPNCRCAWLPLIGLRANLRRKYYARRYGEAARS